MSTVYTNPPRADEAAVAGFAKLGVATVHEAQGRTGLMLPYMRPVYAGARAAGTAVTVSLAPCDNWMLHVVVEQCQPGDVVVLKHHWGAFTGTDLDLQLRRRGVKTVVVAGIATNFGVESTVRSAWELSYDVVVVEDACTSMDADLHRFAIDKILPRIARITSADDLTLGE